MKPRRFKEQLQRFFDVSEPGEKRNWGLDFIRAFAITLVLLSHGQYMLLDNYPSLQIFWFMDGVDLFFVLSGFLIGRILLKKYEEQKTFSVQTLFGFWVRRWFRTLPAYYIVLSLYVVINKPVYIETTWKFFMKYYLFLQNLKKFPSYFFPESWSLSIEEWFYLTLPLLLFLLQLIPIRRKYLFLTGIFLLMTFSMAYRMGRSFKFGPVDDGFMEIYFRGPVFLRLDAIAWGVLLSYLHYYHKPLWSRLQKPAWAITGLVIIILNEHLNTYGFLMKVFHFTICSIGISLLIPWFEKLVAGPQNAWGRWVTHISKISYSLYLLNLSLIMSIIVRVMNPDELLPSVILFIAFLLSSVVLSTLFYKYVEHPLTGLREYFKNRR